MAGDWRRVGWDVIDSTTRASKSSGVRWRLPAVLVVSGGPSRRSAGDASWAAFGMWVLRGTRVGGALLRVGASG